MITTKDIGKNNKQRSEEYEKNMDPDPKSRLAMEEFSGATTISVKDSLRRSRSEERRVGKEC